MQSLLILGRQPELGLTELVSLYGEAKVAKLSSHAAIVDVDPCLLAFDRLGGSLKFAKVLTELDTNEWSDVEDYLIKASPEPAKRVPEGKLTIGLSGYGFNLTPKMLSSTGLKLKRSIQATSRSVRIVPNKEEALNTAQVIHNKLTADRGWELLFVKSGNKTYLAQTVKVQDIAAYARRDQARPYRDAKVGMLPPKLAQIMINLASGELSEDQLTNICETESNHKTKLNLTLLDPFCGSGVVLQEALLMGYDVIGSDLSPKMVDFSQKNLEWLSQTTRTDESSEVFLADATTKQWDKFDLVATEVDLGKPLTQKPDEAELNQAVEKADKLVKQFLANLAKQSRPGLRICIAIPAWQVAKGQFKRLPLIDQISDMGYNFLDFKHFGAGELIYCRPDQVVGRELLVISRK